MVTGIPQEGPVDADEYSGVNDGDEIFRSYQQALALSEQDIVMAAPNKQPSGSRPGPKAPNTHAPIQAGSPSASQPGGSAPSTQDGTKTVVTKPTGPNKNRLH